MSAEVIFAIARHDGTGANAPVRDRAELLAMDGVLLLRDAAGRETPCDGTDVAAVISSMPVLHEIRAGEETRISCSSDIAAQLPFVLQPVPAVGDPNDCYAEVNGDPWMAYPTVAEGNVMLPMSDETEPHVAARWAEHQVEAGEWNPLVGHTVIGLARPGVVVEFGWYDHGGIDSRSAVSVKRLDDFATAFVDWLLNDEVLRGLWDGDSYPALPVELFASAAAAKDHRASSDSGRDDDEAESDDEDEDDGSYAARASLELHLSNELIEQVRVVLSMRVAE
ncbi:hypothetical protein [Mycolicibacter heraklionensis]|uniref:hypothetical protein n=1 Tax=Mycolicibacter heraklionensis TaxID=512402 RepID=UPI0007EB5333|nr:hypothetical protein [Mycolicibacter heraklionensis]OBG34932.1 hypothetical protein A5671_03780 [Mycolicibacter heraklionensis]